MSVIRGQRSETTRGRIEKITDFEVFKRAFKISCEIHKLSLTFPKIEQYALADQLRRSTKSICANLSEGFGRQRGSKPEFARFVMIALGSSDEAQTWILYARQLGYINSEDSDRFIDEYQQISRMLQSLYTSLRKLISDN